MKYRLALDLGVSSIGAAVIKLSEDDKALDIVDAGVRIFKVSEGAEDRRVKRQARKNNKRTKKRLKLLSQKLFEKGFWEHVSPETPAGKEKIKPYSVSPYTIRARAINYKLNYPYELGRALLHMAKHRGAGFIEAMEDIGEDGNLETKESSEKKSRLSSYDKLPEYLRSSDAKTIGEYFHIRLSAKPEKEATGRIVRQRTTDSLVKEKPVDYAIPRYLVKEEFNLIWDKQKEYYPALQSEDFKNEIYDILFYERPSAPYATADCIYIDGEKRLLKAHPLSEKRRIYEAVNNISITTNTEKIKLTKEERDRIINDILMQGANANKTSVGELLGVKKKDIIFSDGETGIKPYLYSKDEFKSLPAFTSITDEQLTKLAEFMAEPVIPDDKQGRLYNEDNLIKQLKSKLKISDEKQISDLLAKLPKGRGSLGITATTKIVELLEENVISHRKATELLVKSGDKRFKAEEVLAQEVQGKYKELPYYGEILRKDVQPIHPWQKIRNQSLNEDEAKYGKIANPAVHMMLNQLRLVVNDIIRIYGRPYEINIELGRDVGMSAKKKNQYEEQQKKNQEINEKAAEELKNNNVKVMRANILKYKLMKEQDCKDAFNPHNPICTRRLGDFEIEHLIPQSKGGTDAYNNLVLVSRNENSNKGNNYPHEYFLQSKTEEQIREILCDVRGNSKIADGKKWRFEPDARKKFEAEGDVDESSRYLTDSRYVAKLAARYLRAILDFKQTENSDVINTRILTVNGFHTAKLRTAWNLDGLEYELMGLDVPRYLECDPYWKDEETGVVEKGTQKPDKDGKWKFYDKKRNPDWKKKSRIDHRHHALDAITFGCINRNFVQEMNWTEKRGYTLSNSAYPLPFASMDKKDAKAARAKFRQKVLSLLKDMRISHKSEHSIAGELHKGTGRNILDYKDLTITKHYRNIMKVLKQKSDLSNLKVNPAIKDEWHPYISVDRKELEELVDNFKLHFDKAQEELVKRNEESKEQGRKAKEVSEAMILKEAFKIIQSKGLWRRGSKFPTYANKKSLVIIDKHKIAYESGNNHRVDFYESNGKVFWQVINNFNANDNNFIPDSKKARAKPIWSVHKGDLIEITNTDSLIEDLTKRHNKGYVTKEALNQWAHFVKKKPCLARVKKFSDRINISFAYDARMDPPKKDSPKYNKYMYIEDLGVGFRVYGKYQARKVELTPLGKIKKKHKALWHGKKDKS